jgi:hypothetical protein
MPRVASDRRLWLLLFTAVAVLYAVGARWANQANDAEAAAWPAWALAHHGTLHLEGLAGLPSDNRWFLHLHGHIVSNRMIGVVLAGVPVNVLLGWTGLTPTAAGAITSILMAAAAVATVGILFRRLTGTATALVATAVIALGTAMWTVASRQLWTHAPDAMWLSLAMVAVSRRRYVLAGLAFMPAVLTRPHLVAAALVLALALAALERRAAPLVIIPVAVAALGILVFLNREIFGAWSVGGGYSEIGYSVQGVATPANGHHTALLVLQRLAGAFLSPWCGLLLYTPVLLLALAAVPRALRQVPAWTVAAAAGGCAYELAQCLVNDFTGGNMFFGNRLVIEWIVLCAPLLVCSLQLWVRKHPALLPAVAGLATASVAIHAIGMLLDGWRTERLGSGWREWYLGIMVRDAGVYGVTLATVALLATGLAVAFSVRAERQPVSCAARPGSSRSPDGSAAEQALPA